MDTRPTPHHDVHRKAVVIAVRRHPPAADSGDPSLERKLEQPLQGQQFAPLALVNDLGTRSVLTSTPGTEEAKKDKKDGTMSSLGR